jgi:hypothetical protein
VQKHRVTHTTSLSATSRSHAASAARCCFGKVMACWVRWLRCRSGEYVCCSPNKGWLSCWGVELRVCWFPDPRLTPAVSQTVSGCVQYGPVHHNKLTWDALSCPCIS